MYHTLSLTYCKQAILLSCQRLEKLRTIGKPRFEASCHRFIKTPFAGKRQRQSEIKCQQFAEDVK